MLIKRLHTNSPCCVAVGISSVVVCVLYVSSLAMLLPSLLVSIILSHNNHRMIHNTWFIAMSTTARMLMQRFAVACDVTNDVIFTSVWQNLARLNENVQ